MKKKLLTSIAFLVSVSIFIIGGKAAYQSYGLKIAKEQSMQEIENQFTYKDYRIEQREELYAIVKQYSEEIKAASSKEEVSKKLNCAKNEFSKVKTDKKLDEEERESVSIAQAEEESRKQKKILKKKTEEESKKKAEKESKKVAEKESKEQAEKESREAESRKEAEEKARSYTENFAKQKAGGCVGNDAKNFY